jgi:hypothetical protein
MTYDGAVLIQTAATFTQEYLRRAELDDRGLVPAQVL